MPFDEEHRTETYKSLISIASEELKAILLLNGGAIIAILAYPGDSERADLATRLKCPIGWFVAGLITISIAFVTSYLTQLCLYNESVHLQSYKGPRHQFLLWPTLILVLISLISFSVGAFSAVTALST